MDFQKRPLRLSSILHNNQPIFLLDAGATAETKSGLPANQACTALNTVLGIFLATGQYQNDEHLRQTVADLLWKYEMVDPETQCAFLEPMEVLDFLEQCWKEIAGDTWSLSLTIFGEDPIPIIVGTGKQINVTLYYAREHFYLIVSLPQLQSLSNIILDMENMAVFPAGLFTADDQRLAMALKNRWYSTLREVQVAREGQYFSFASIIKCFQSSKINLQIQIPDEDTFLLMLPLFDPEDHTNILNLIYSAVDLNQLPCVRDLAKESNQPYFHIEALFV